MATIAFSYIWVLCMPIPQNMANASTKFSSFLVKTCREYDKYRVNSNRNYFETDSNAFQLIGIQFEKWKFLLFSFSLFFVPTLSTSLYLSLFFKAKILQSSRLTNSSNLFISWITPIIWPSEFLMAIQSIDLCLNVALSSTLGSNRWSS